MERKTKGAGKTSAKRPRNSGSVRGGHRTGGGDNVPSEHVRRGKEPVVELLDELRADPSPVKIQAILDHLKVSRFDYFNVRKAAERAFTRPLTNEEKALIARLP